MVWEEDREEKDRKKTHLNTSYEFYFGINHINILHNCNKNGSK